MHDDDFTNEEQNIPLVPVGEPGGSLVDNHESPPAKKSARIWSLCLIHADKYDQALVESWKGDMDGILIFSGLFSAIVTAFLIDNYKTLQQPDVPTTTMNLTAQMVALLALTTNHSNPELPPLPSPNSQQACLVINALWFLSLVFSLACALAATLVQQWSRVYMQGTLERFDPHQRARMRTYLQQGVQKFYLSELVGAIPLLIHASVFLFFAGLIVSLFNLDNTLAKILLCLTIAVLFVYILLTILPVLYPDCPFKTPLTSILSSIKYAIADRRAKRRGGDEAQNPLYAKKDSEYLASQWDKDDNIGADLDHMALRWTLLALKDNKDLEEFIGALPSLLQSDSSTSLTYDGSVAAQALLFGEDMLAAEHLVRLLHSTVMLASVDRQRLDTRAATCLNVVSLLSRSCKGPKRDHPDDWIHWIIWYFNPVVRDTFALRARTNLASLAESTALVLAWRALVAYRDFLWDITRRTAHVTGVTGELQSRLRAGNYLAQALFSVLRGLSSVSENNRGGMPLATARDTLLTGPGRTYLQVDVSGIAVAAREDLKAAKTCLAVLFMHATCLLPLPTKDAVNDTLQALAAPLSWPEECDYDKPGKAKSLLAYLRDEHLLPPLSEPEAKPVIDLYLGIHNPNPQLVQNKDASSGEGPSNFDVRRRNQSRGTL